jgi:hypothetical protein
MKLNFLRRVPAPGALLSALSLMAQSPTTSPPAASVNAPFVQEVPRFFAQADGLPSDDIRQLAALADGRVVAADAAGRLAVFQNHQWAAMASPGFAVRKLCAAGAALWAFGEGRAAVLQQARWLARPAPPEPEVHAVAAWNNGALVAAGEGLWHVTDTQCREWPWARGRIQALAVTDSGRVAAGTDDGLYLAEVTAANQAPAFRPVYPADARYSWSPRRVRAVVAEGPRLWFGAENGAGVFDGREWQLFTGREGLPWNGFTCAASDGTNTWFGTDRGALWPGTPTWAYRASRRWLPADAVSAVAVDAGGVWLAGPAGVARLERRAMTLADKAAHFERLIEERHTRMGYVVRCRLKTPGDFSTAWISHTDNDGLYTAMYGAAECFRFAATRDPEARRRATNCLAALKLLFDATGIPGFPARSVVPTTWRPDPNEGFGAAANAAEKARDPLWKNILPRWPKSADGQYWWKCDTSSDEICGHYFFYAAYHDFVAETPAEKAAVAAVVRALTDHIVDHGFRLVDHDGLPTRWGNWSPEYCHSPEGWADRGIQAVEILSFLNVAHHVTGDAKYRAAAARLRDRHACHINALDGRAVFPPENVVPWDNNLAFLSYWGLIRYEPDPELRALYRASLERNWLFVSRHNDPFFNFMFAALNRDEKPADADRPAADFPRLLGRGAQTLRGMPLLLVGWPATNSHRLDVVFDPTPGQKPAYGWSAVTGEALPVEERSQIRINSDSLSLDGGFGGDVEYEGTYFLLPYYLGLHHGFLGK